MIHAVADSSGFYLCKNAEDARELALMQNRNCKHHGGKTMFGWLFNCDSARALLAEHDTAVYVKVRGGEVISCGIQEFLRVWDESKNCLAQRIAADLKKEGEPK
jgi:hypothetical protein